MHRYTIFWKGYVQLYYLFGALDTEIGADLPTYATCTYAHSDYGASSGLKGAQVLDLYFFYVWI